MKLRAFLGSVAGAVALSTAAGGGGGGGGHDLELPVDPVDPPVDPVDPPVEPPVDPDPVRQSVKDAMRRATKYMDETVSYRGSYVWYVNAADPTKRWGEMEAFPTMCWMQSSSTPNAGHCFLDAYHATGDETFYKAAERTALALLEAQHPSGGWNYIYDFAGEASLKRWYETVGINGWRLEEFQHYYGNATFDDANTAIVGQFMLRMYLEKKDPRFKASIEKVIDFIIDAQFKSGIVKGGWPQRFPRYYAATASMPAPNWPPYTGDSTGNWDRLKSGEQNGDWITRGPGGPGVGYTGIFSGMEDGDYTNFLTFNDDVIAENIKLLTLCMFGLGRMDLKERIIDAMDCVVNTLWRFDPGVDQIPAWVQDHMNTSSLGNVAGLTENAPRATIGNGNGLSKQCGWSLQHLSADTVDAYGFLRPAGAPAAARTYEARGISPAVSVANCNLLLHFFRLTGNKRYLVDIPDVIRWINESGCGLRADQVSGPEINLSGTSTHTRMVELYTNRPRFVHRYGSNIWNGGYYFDYDCHNTPSHYGVGSGLATSPGTALSAYTRMMALTNDQIARMVAASPLNTMSEKPLPKYFYVNGEIDFPHLFAGTVKGTDTQTEAQATALVDSLGDKSYWTVNQSTFTNAYTQNGPSAPYYGKEYMSRHVGDQYDTSPFANSLGNQMPNMPPYTTNPPTVQPIIQTSTFVNNMNSLITFISPITPVTDPDYKA
ncbi:MAG: pectate lyase [Candidatus Accumulibacter sp.]|jgi:hypothetical protein|nr:pectate lyase [Accumulibacter sp.]